MRAPGQPSALAQVFEQLSAGEPASTQALSLGYRTVKVVRRSATVVWCTYGELCEQPLAAMDFMALCDTFSAILMSEVPNLSAQKRPGRIARAN